MNLTLTALLLLTAQPPAVKFLPAELNGVDVVASLNAAQQKVLPAGILTVEQGEAWLRVCVLDADKPGPPMLGRFERTDADLIFRPRFGFEPGRRYRAFFGTAGGPIATADYLSPLRNNGAAATVSAIYPTADILPANHLKFHIVFSQPMRGGQEIFKQIEILDANGEPLSETWLKDELWDESGTVLILYIHPGRIKWGVVLREILGPVLVPRREYSLIIREAMLDANGQKLAKDVVKKFKTIDEDRKRIDLSEWTISPPKAGSREPLTVAFPKSLDRASLTRFLTIHDTTGRIEGTMTLGKHQRSWSFTPARPWEQAEYRLAIDGKLEDVAGNTPLRAFDLDLQAPREPPQRLDVRFTPQK